MSHFLLADDHAMIRAGIKFFIKSFMPHSTVDEAEDGDSAFKMVKEKDYDLVILDINMPDTDSFDLVRNLLANKPGLNILMCSLNDEEIYAKRYLQIGVMGYLNKDAPEQEIRNAITEILNGRKYTSKKLNDLFVNDLLKNKISENPFDRLSAREFEIAQHLIKGTSVSEISQILHLHPSTVGTHKTRILNKIGCKNIFDMHNLAKLYSMGS